MSDGAPQATLDDADGEGADVQFRGHCACCGDVWAVMKSGLCSKHGYTKKMGWFSGVCPGQHYQPIERDRVPTDRWIANIREEVPKLRALADAIDSGAVVLETVKRKRKASGYSAFNQVYEMVDVKLAELPAYERDAAVRQAVSALRQRAASGDATVDALQKSIELYHGQPLIEVERRGAPDPIRAGERRTSADGARIYTAKRTERGRVYYTHGERKFEGWLGIAAWRRLAKAPE